MVGGTKVHERGPESSQPYRPYPVDWRFLPEEFLILKDFARAPLSDLSNTIARQPGLRRLWTASLGRRTLNSISRAGVLFIHVTKAGGTSISQCLYGRNLPHYSASFYQSVFPARITQLPSFAIIRHPVERFISTYAFLRAGGSDVMACDRIQRRRMGELASIDTVVDHLHAKSRALSPLPAAFQRQCDYVVGDDDSVLVDRLFSLNRAEGFSPELGRWLGRPIVPHINATGSESISISEESRRKVGEIYSRDFALYRALVANGGHLDVEGARHRLAS
jgi:hypothetical protein